MTQHKKEQFRAHQEVVEKWVGFVRVNSERGKKREEIRERLIAANLTEEQADILFDPDFYYWLDLKKTSHNTWVVVIAILKTISGIGLTLIGLAKGGLSLVAGPLLLAGGIVWLSRYRRG